jgi:hypothetical protein
MLLLVVLKLLPTDVPDMAGPPPDLAGSVYIFF